jgi:hypothetical protein
LAAAQTNSSQSVKEISSVELKAILLTKQREYLTANEFVNN